MDPSFELFDHTADLGLRVRAPDLPGLIPPAAAALYVAIGRLVPTASSTPWSFQSDLADPALALRAFLAELLDAFERLDRIVVDPRAERFDAGGLRVVGRAALLDPDAGAADREVKAVTYHALDIRPVPGGLEATFILDI